MSACATYTISLSGPSFDVMDMIAFLSEKINDQDCFQDFNLTNRFCDNDDDDEDDIDFTLFHREELIEVYETHDCVWLEDIEDLAKAMVHESSDVLFSISGHIEDSESDDMMDFKICYTGKKLISQSSCWYIYIHMDEFKSYESFCRKFSDKYGHPRYTEEDYEGFKACADEWYVMDSGMGEFSVDVSLNEPVRIKLTAKQ